MAYRSVWKGFLKLALITCPVKLYAATAEADKQSFTLINPKTGNKVDFSRVDSVTGEAIEFKDMGKGIEVGAGVYAEVTKDELDGIAPKSVHTIEIQELVPRSGITWLFPDAAYYLGPDGLAAGEAFALLRDGIKATKLVALGQLSMGSREHIIALDPGAFTMKVSTLRYAAEVRSEEMCFPDFNDIPYDRELSASVAKILADRMQAAFDPEHFTDRYAAAIAELVRDKIAGKTIKRTVTPPPKLIDLEKAVRRSAGIAGKPDKRKKQKRSKAA